MSDKITIMNKTKEELIDDLYNEFEDFRFDYGVYDLKTFEQSDAFKKVNEYAKNRCIKFKEWQDVNLEDKKWENYDGHDTWINPHTRQVVSTSELYEIFLTQQ